MRAPRTPRIDGILSRRKDIISSPHFFNFSALCYSDLFLAASAVD